MQCNDVSRRRFMAACIAFAALPTLSAGCGRELSDADAAKAKASVERALRAPSFEGFLAPFTRENQARMREVAIWIRWWQEKFEKNRAGWQVLEVKGLRDGRIEVVTEHRSRKTSHQFFRLRRVGSAWLIDEIESER